MWRRRGNQSRRFLEPYQDAIVRHGPSFEATLWASRDAQRLRFDVMIEMAELIGGRIVDAGCGRGDFAERLLEREVGFAAYVGLDAIEPQIESARSRGMDRQRVSFETADLLEDPAALFARHEPDWVCISGTLNTMDDQAARELVGAAFGAASRGVVYNFLSDRCSAVRAAANLFPARRFDTVSWLDWSLSLTPRVAFRQDYMDGHDATVVLGRMEAGGAS